MLAPSPARPDAGHPSLRVALGLVAIASKLVAAADRRAWQSEWHAELISHAEDLASPRRAGPWLHLDVIWRAAGSFVDALYLTAHGFGPTNLAHDLGQAARALRKRPGFTLTAVVTLALGIGANTALFGVLRGVLRRPFPYHEPGRLVQLLGQREGDPLGSGNVSYPNLHDLEREVGGLGSVAGLSSWRPALTGDEPEVLAGATVSWDYFGVLGVNPAVGRFFLSEDEGEGREPVVVISHGLWTRRFGEDLDIAGASISINNTTYRVLGVAPANFEGPHLISFDGDQPVIWRTPWFEASSWFRSGRSWKGIARLAEGVDRAVAQAEVAVVMDRLAEQFPEENAQRQVALRPLRESVVGASRSALYVLLGAVALVLLVACVNVANLLTGRMLERHDELLVRNALGASRGRLVTHLFAESLAIAIVGGGLGILLAYWGVGAIVTLAGTWLPRPEAIAVDGVGLGFSTALACGTALLFGLLPALRVLGGARLSSVAGSRAGGAAGRHTGSLRRGLVLCQVATSVVLVIGAGLLLQTFQNLQQVELGVERDGMITMNLHGAAWWDLETDVAAAQYRQILDRVEGLPGVEIAGAIDVVPLSDNYSCDGVTPLDQPPPAPGQGRCAEVRSATPGALAALGVQLRAGRLLEWRDDANATGSMVVSQRTGDVFWPGEELLGKQALIHSDTFTVVGVVADIRHFGPEADVEPMVFLSALQEPWNGITRGLSLVVRGDRCRRGDGSRDSRCGACGRSDHRDREDSSDGRPPRRDGRGASSSGLSAGRVRGPRALARIRGNRGRHGSGGHAPATRAGHTPGPGRGTQTRHGNGVGRGGPDHAPWARGGPSSRHRPHSSSSRVCVRRKPAGSPNPAPGIGSGVRSQSARELDTRPAGGAHRPRRGATRRVAPGPRAYRGSANATT